MILVGYRWKISNEPATLYCTMLRYLTSYISYTNCLYIYVVSILTIYYFISQSHRCATVEVGCAMSILSRITWLDCLKYDMLNEIQSMHTFTQL